MEVVEITCRNDWEREVDTARAPLQQRWAYGVAMAGLGAGVQRLSIRDGTEMLGHVQILCRRVCGVPLALGSRGPCWADKAPTEARVAGLRMLRKSVPGVLILTPDATETALPLARLFPVMTAGTMARLELNDGMRARMHGKWRNRLVRAERTELTAERLKPARLGWLFDAEEAARQTKGYCALPRTFVQKWPNPVLAFGIFDRGQPIAAMMFLRHGSTATYHIGWSSDAGRRASAHNLLLWRAMQALRTESVEQIDLGTLDTVNAPGLARFKLGSGAVPVTTGGTWLGW